MTAEEWQKKAKEYAKMIIDFIHSRDLGLGFLGPLFSQVTLAFYGGFPWLFTDEAPRPGENWVGKDPREVIKLCEPFGKEDSMADVINNIVKWLARWTQRVIPDRKMMMDAFALAEAALLREAWAKGFC